MDLEEMKRRLKATGYPVMYSHSKTKQTLPYICFMIYGESGFAADGVRYSKADQYRIELYTATKDRAAETAVETAISDIFFDKDTVWIDAEKCYQTIYEMEV